MQDSSSRFFKNSLHDDLAQAGPQVTARRAFDLGHLCLERSRWGGDFSVYTGTAGLALMCGRLANLKVEVSGGEAERIFFCKMAVRCIEEAEKSLKRSGGSHSHSLICGAGGVLVAKAIVACDRGVISKYLELSREVTAHDFPHNELLYGRAGVLYGLLQLQALFGQEVPDHSIQTVAYSIVTSGRQFVKSGDFRGHSLNPPPMFWEWHRKLYLGAAHGALGILHTLLLVPPRIWKGDESVMRDTFATLDFVLEQWSHENLPSSLGKDSSNLVHWCHGAPGLVLTCSKAYELSKKKQYLTAAARAAQTVWDKGLLRKGPGLCHGIAGNAYAFLALYQASSDELYLRRAHCFAEFLTSAEFRKVAALGPDHPYSLFEGLGGAACLYADLAIDPKLALFPCYGL